MPPIWKVVEGLGLSYKTVQELNKKIDKLPGRAPFVSKDMAIGGEVFTFYYWEIIPCLRALFGDPEFQHDLIFAPERHFTNEDRTHRIYSDMHTGDWWWSVQVRYSVHK